MTAKSDSQAQLERWQKAQAYEEAWWGEHNPDLNYFRDFAREVTESTGPYLTIGPDTGILEVGCGPAGALTFLDSGRRYAIDPLEDYFCALEHVQAFRDPAVNYTTGKCEALPYPDNDFGLVIMDNVLDHCQDPQQALDEIDRVLKPGGVIFFRQNVYHLWGRFVRWAMEIFQIDRGHPHTFSRGGLVRDIRRRGWEVVAYQASGFARSWWGELTDGTRKGLIKALLFATRNRSLFIIQKRA